MQQATEVAAADLPGNPQGLDQPIGNRIAEPFLKTVQALLETAGGAVVLSESSESWSKLLRSTDRQLAQRLWQREARADGPPLTHLLVDAMPSYATTIGPIAENVAHVLGRTSPGKINLRTPLTRANNTRAQTRGARSANRKPHETTGGRPRCRPVATAESNCWSGADNCARRAGR